MTISSDNTIEKMAEMLAYRALVVRRSAKSAAHQELLHTTDRFTKRGQQVLGAVNASVKQANPYIDKAVGAAKGWWDQAKTYGQGGAATAGSGLSSLLGNQPLRNALIGGGVGALGGALLNRFNTDEDDPRRHPGTSALTGALGGAALGGLGTLGLKHWKDYQTKDPNLGSMQAQEINKTTGDNAASVAGALNTANADAIPFANPDGSTTAVGLGDSVAKQWRDEFVGNSAGISPEAASAGLGVAQLPGIAKDYFRSRRTNLASRGLDAFTAGNAKGVLGSTSRPGGFTGADLSHFQSRDAMKQLEQAARRAYRPQDLISKLPAGLQSKLPLSWTAAGKPVASVGGQALSSREARGLLDDLAEVGRKTGVPSGASRWTPGTLRRLGRGAGAGATFFAPAIADGLAGLSLGEDIKKTMDRDAKLLENLRAIQARQAQ